MVRQRHCLGGLVLLFLCACGASDHTLRLRDEGGAGGEDNGGAASPSEGGMSLGEVGGAPAGDALGGEAQGGEASIPSRCAPATGPAIQHQSGIEADETWGAGLHDVTFDIRVQNDATLTIEPCAVVRVVDSRGFQIVDGGRLIAKGAADRPIVFQGKDGATWASLEVGPLGFADLAYVTVTDAGDLGSTRGRSGAALDLYGANDLPVQALARVDHVTLKGAQRFGAALETRAAFSDDSSDLTIEGSGEMALWVSAASLGSIPPGNYTGNARDAIRILNDTDVFDDETIHDRGVPYVVGGSGSSAQIRVHGTDDALAVLTIEPHVMLRFPKSDRDSALYLRHASNDPIDAPAGALVAVGTKEQPIVFTSDEDEPAAGDWVGVWFESWSSKSRMDYVQVEYAGGDTGTSSFSCGTPQAPDQSINRAAIAVFTSPETEFVTHTTISDSAWNAFERGWTDGSNVDFRPSNEFINIQYCSQTYPRQTGPAASCPAACDP